MSRATTPDWTVCVGAHLILALSASTGSLELFVEGCDHVAFPLSTLSCQHHAGLVQVTILLGVQVCSLLPCHAQGTLSGSLVLALTVLLLSLLGCSRSLCRAWGGRIANVSVGVGCSTATCSPHCDQLWISVVVSCCRKVFLC